MIRLAVSNGSDLAFAEGLLMSTDQPQGTISSAIRLTTDLWKKHAAEVGEVVIAWSFLQEMLGHIFADILHPAPKGALLAAWHSLRSDRAQRDMLEATARAIRGKGDA